MRKSLRSTCVAIIAQSAIFCSAAIQCIGVRALACHMLRVTSSSRLLDVSRQRVPESFRLAIMLKPDHICRSRCDVPRDFMQFQRFGDRQRGFLGIDLVILARRRVQHVDLEPERRRGFRRHRQTCGLRGCDAHAFEVSGSGDGPVHGRDVAEAVLQQAVRQRMDALGAQFLLQDVGAQRPSSVACTWAWSLNAKGRPWISSDGTTPPRMPPIEHIT